MWSTVLGFILKVVGWIIGKGAKNAKVYDAFLDFVAVAESNGLASVNLNDTDRKQTDELKRRRSLPSDKLNGGN